MRHSINSYRHILAIVLLTLIAMPAWANICVDGIYYEIKGNEAHVTWKAHREYVYKGAVTIPSHITYRGKSYPVTAIGDCAFTDCTKLTSVTIPNTVTSIGGCGFCNCKGLTSVTIPNSVKTIGNLAFANCDHLTSVTISNSAVSIGERAFSHCDALTSVVIPNSVKTIGMYAFYGCGNLTSVTIPNSVKTIGKFAFDYCDNLTSVYIPNSVRSIGTFAFNSCKKLTLVTVPKSATIGDYAFSRSTQVVIRSDAGPAPTPTSVTTPVTTPAASYTYAEYISNKAGSWDAFLAAKGVQKPKVADAADIKMQVEREINTWQQKGEFERTAQWQQRVNETSRNAKVKEITARIQAENKRKVDDYNSKLANCKKEYEAKIKSASDEYCLSKATQFASQPFELKPYDADNETFLISSQTAGDILLPVPIGQAQNFKQNWSNIKKNVKAEYVPVGDNVALKSVTFGAYTYDSNTKANYAVTTVDYNFAPIEISDVDLAAVDYKFDAIADASPSMTVSNPEAKTVATTKVTPQQNKVAVGNASDVDRNIPDGAAKAANTFAIVIANENYKNVVKVDNAANDGKIVAKYLTGSLGVPQNQVFTFIDASYGEIIGALDKLKNYANAYSGSDYNVIFYYAGHGVPDERSRDAYLLPVDGLPGNSAVSIELGKLYDTLGSLGASSVYVMLDACFSGAQRGDGMLAQARGVAIKAKTAEPRGNMIVLSAAQGDETAYPYKSQNHGLFTYFLLKKLQLTRGNVTIGDLADYVIDNVKKTSVAENNGKLQTPTVRASLSAPTDWRAQKLTK